MKNKNVCLLVLLVFTITKNEAYEWSSINLPANHIPIFFANNPNLKAECREDPMCPYKGFLNITKCWGYEDSCNMSQRHSNPDCSADSRCWVQSKEEQLDQFWRSADFGQILERRKEMKHLCKAERKDDSSLQCAKFLRYCTATNIFFNFSSANIVDGADRNRYRDDIIGSGQVGGHCKWDKNGLKTEGGHKGPLQSWFAELEHFTSVNFFPSKSDNCDITFDKPTFIIKPDLGVNMYHHFCDFVNLYASQHINNSFSTDVNIILWDTSWVPYPDHFSITWKAFTDHPIIPLKDLDGKMVCFKEAVFPVLARARFGLFYLMPLIPGCYGSSLIKAFSEHILHRLSITQEGPLENKIRITLLSRDTKYRNIMNQEELASAMISDGEFEVTVIQYSRHMPFLDQLQHSHNSDIFIGIHGAGLTHLLFQPDWAVVMELYNCDETPCYYDLARLRGIKYMTWENKRKMTQEDEGNHPSIGPHAKFTNYAFDVNEFMRLIYKAADHVRSHPAFRRARQKLYGCPENESLNQRNQEKTEL